MVDLLGNLRGNQPDVPVGPGDPNFVGPLTPAESTTLTSATTGTTLPQGQGFFPQGYQTGQGNRPGGTYTAPAPEQVAPGPPANLADTATRLWSLESTNGNEDQIRQMEQLAAQQVAANPVTADNLRHWASIIPTMPGGALIALASSGVTPDTSLGQWLIRSATPALGQGTTWKPPDINAVTALLSNPDRLSAIQRLPVSQQAELFKHGVWNVGKLTDAQLQHLEQTGNLPDQGWTGYIGDITRPIFSGLESGAQFVGASLRSQQAVGGDVSPTGHGILAGTERAVGGPRPASEFFGRTIPLAGGASTTFGTPEQVHNLVGQTSAGQAIEGKSLGQGIFPGGPAEQATQEAQRAAANINGHALTPGRALASTITTPGELPYNLMSGSVDFGVAMEADPAATLLGQLGAANAARKLFAATSEEAIASTADHLIARMGPENAQALQTWAIPELADKYQGAIARSAAGADLRGSIIDKLSANPGSMQDLVDQGLISPREVLNTIAGKETGRINALQRWVQPKDALTYLNSPAGINTVKKMAGMTGTDIYLRSGKAIPPEVAFQLGKANTEDAVRGVFADAIQGQAVRGVPYLASHPFQDLRLASRMPNYAVDSQDTNAMVERGLRELQLGKVPKAEWDGYLSPLGLAQNRADAYNGFINLGNRVGAEILNRTPGYVEDITALNAERSRLMTVARATLHNPDRTLTPANLQDLQAQGSDISKYTQLLGKTNATKKMAQNMTTYFQKNAEEDRQWWVDAMGQQPSVPGLALDGNPLPIDGPYGVSELLNRAIPQIGGDGINGLREIKRAVGVTAPIWRAPIIGKGLRAGTYAADFLTGAFKVGTLARLALPVRFLADEQARMATAGIPSMFHNPMSYIAYVTARKSMTDVTGERFADQLADHQSTVSRAIGQTGQWREELMNGDRTFSKGWGTFSRDNPNYVGAWSDRLSHASIDPIGKAVARAITNPVDTGGLDAVKNAFWSGKLAGTREDLINANLWGGNSAALANRAQADAYVDGWAQRLNDVTAGGHDELMQAVASGEPWQGVDQGTSGFRRLLGSLNDQERSPAKVVGPIEFKGAQVGMMRRATNAMFSALMSHPTSTLTRSPAFREAYFQRIQELLPHMDDATQAQVISRAAENGITLHGGIAAAGAKLSLEQADMLAKDFGLQTVHHLLYYPGERSNAVDVLRNVIPFGNAWKNVLGTWAKLTAENPQVVRRVQQGVTEARESGWWYTDPQDGTEKFTIIPAGIMQHLAGVPFPMVGQVKGLNIVGQGLPGVGPAIQWPAADFFSSVHGLPAENFFQQHLMPYGDPDFSGGTLETLFPGWWNKLKTTGWFGKTPLLGQSAQENLVLNHVAMQAFNYQMSTGKYNLHDPNVLQQVWAQSLHNAKMLYMWRGLAQFASPAAPSYIANARLPGGQMVEQWVMAQDYRNMLNATGDSFKATLQFVQKYGANNVFSSQPFTTTKVFGLPTTAEAEVWKSQHQGFAANYPEFTGYWAPQGGAFDYNAYLQQIKDGTRETPTGADWYQLATARLGNAVYNQLRQQLPSSPNKAQTDWLDQWKTKLTGEFPGFNQDQLKTSHNTTAQNMIQLASAVRDPAVKNTPLANAVTVYLELRDRALGEAKTRGYTTLGGNNVGDLRDWLFSWGTQIANKMPEFTTIWNDMLQSEVQPNG